MLEIYVCDSDYDTLRCYQKLDYTTMILMMLECLLVFSNLTSMGLQYVMCHRHTKRELGRSTDDGATSDG